MFFFKVPTNTFLLQPPVINFLPKMTTEPNQNTGVSRLIPGYKYNTTTKNYLHSFNHLKATKTYIASISNHLSPPSLFISNFYILKFVENFI